MQDIRTSGLSELASEAKMYREDATDIHQALEKLKDFLKKLKNLCTEVIFSMGFRGFEKCYKSVLIQWDMLYNILNILSTYLIHSKHRL